MSTSTTTDTIPFIVNKLNNVPFYKKYSLVDFDSLGNYFPLLCEVLSLIHSDFQKELNTITTTMNNSCSVDNNIDSDSSSSSRQAVVVAALLFKILTVLGYKLIPHDNNHNDDEQEEWMNSLVDNKEQQHKDVSLPLLHWLLSHWDRLKKRAYLSKFLMPIEPPVELQVFENPMLDSLVLDYKNLQVQFKAVHKEYERTQQALSLKCPDHRSDLNVLDKEMLNLLTQLDKMKTLASQQPGLSDLVYAIGKIKHEEAQQIHFRNQLTHQQKVSSKIEEELNHIKTRLIEMKQNLMRSTSVEDLLDNLALDVQSSCEKLLSQACSDRRVAEQHLTKLDQDFAKPSVSLDQINKQQQSNEALGDECTGLQKKVDHLINSNPDNTLSRFRRHLHLASKKLDEKQKDLVGAKDRLELLQFQYGSTVAGNESSSDVDDINDVVIDTSNSKKTSRRDQLMNLQMMHKNLKEKYGDLQLQTAAFMKENESKEAQMGVHGFLDMKSSLDSTNNKTAEMNEVKGKALEEMSSAIAKMTQMLNDKKHTLEPKMLQLKEIQRAHKNIQNEHSRREKQFNNLSNSLNADSLKLKEEADSLESTLKSKVCQLNEAKEYLEVENTNVKKLELQEECLTGKTRFSDEFETLIDHLEHEVQQNEEKSKLLRRKQKRLNEVAAADQNKNGNQKRLFRDLHKLLSFKYDMINSLDHAHISSINNKENDHTQNILDDCFYTDGTTQVLTF